MAKIIYFERHRKKRIVYEVDEGGLLTSFEIEKRIEKGEWRGTYTPQPPYGVSPGEDRENGKNGKDP